MISSIGYLSSLRRNTFRLFTSITSPFVSSKWIVNKKSSCVEQKIPDKHPKLLHNYIWRSFHSYSSSHHHHNQQSLFSSNKISVHTQKRTIFTWLATLTPQSALALKVLLGASLPAAYVHYSIIHELRYLGRILYVE